MAAKIAASNTPSISMGLASHVLDRAIDLNISYMMLSAPGIGKSELVRTAVIKQDRIKKLEQLMVSDSKTIEEYRGVDGNFRIDELNAYLDTLPALVRMIDLRLSQIDNIDVRGMPFPVDVGDGKRITQWILPEFFPTDPESHVVLFLDEITSVQNPSVYAAMYQVVLDRAVGQHKLPKNTRIIAAGNRVTDNSIATDLPAALADRFTINEVYSTMKDFRAYALKHGVDASLLGFLEQNPERLNNFEQNKYSLLFTTPRTWMEVNKILLPKDQRNNPIDREVEHSLIAGRVGNGIAHEFNAYREESDELPNAHDLLFGKANTIPKLRADQYMVLISGVANSLYEQYKLYQSGSVSESKYHSLFNNFWGVLQMIGDTSVLARDLMIAGASTVLQDYRIPPVKQSSNWREFVAKHSGTLKWAILQAS